MLLLGLFPFPAELSTVNPDTVHDHSQPACQGHDRFSNRPFGVKRFQTIHRYGVDVARGLVLLFGIGTRALPSWDSKTRWNNLLVDLTVRVTAGSSGCANSPHPSSREGHHSTARWSSSVLLSDLILCGFSTAAADLFPGPAEFAAVNPDAVHDHSQPSAPAPRSPSLIGQFRVKRFQTIHRYGVDVARGLVLLFGIGTYGPLPSWDSKTRWNNLLIRPYRQSDGRVQAAMRTHLIHRPARNIIPPLGGARVSSYRI